MNSTRQKILFANRSYWPDAEATGQLLTELCEDLAQQFDVVVLAGQPNQNLKDEAFDRNRAEIRNGVTIERVRHPKWSKRSLVGRAINLVGFWFAAAFRLLRMKRPDVLVVETDPFLLPLLGRIFCWWHRCKLVVYLQDLYPDIAVILDKVHEGWLTRFLRSRLFRAYRTAEAIVVLSDDMKKQLVSWGIDSSRIVCIENWVDTSSVFPVKNGNEFRKSLQAENRFIVMHSGNMGLSQYLENVLDAAKLLSDRSDIEILLVGDGATRRSLETKAGELGLKNVRFLPYQPRDQLAQSLSAADLHLISMHPQVHRCMMPSKFYGILASGTPVLAITSKESQLAQLIEENTVGFTATPNDPHELAEKLRWCADRRADLVEMGQRARMMAVENYDRPHQTTRFAHLLCDVISGSDIDFDHRAEASGTENSNFTAVTSG